MRGLNPVKIVLVDEGEVERPQKLEEWLRSWWVDSIKKMRRGDWFKVEGDNLLWATSPT